MSVSDYRTTLFAARVSPLEDGEIYRAAYDAVSPARQKKADSFRFEKDRRLCIGAELLLRCGLRTAGIEKPDTSFVYGPQGKPYLKNCALYFNFSHSGDWVVCALSSCETGCDMQKIGVADLKLARRFFCPEEYEDIAAQSTPQEQRELFCRYWTLKESFLKVTGLGMKLPLNAFRIVRGKEISVIQSVDERSYAFGEYHDLPGYACALCAAGYCENAELKIIDLREFLWNDK